MRATDPAMMIHSAVGAIIGWDEQAERLFGYAASEIIGRPLALLVPDNPFPHEPLAERIGITKDGRSLRVLCRRSLITDGTDRVLAISEVMAACLDDTSRRAPAPEGVLSSSPVTAEGDALPTEEDTHLFRRLLEDLPQLLWCVRSDGVCRYANRQCRAFAAIPEDAPQAFDWLALVHPDDSQRARAEWQACITTGTRLFAEFRLRRHDGVYRWFELCATKGRTVRERAEWVLTGSDIHEARASREQLRIDQTRLHSILETLPGAVISYYLYNDGRAEFAFLSQAGEKLYGFPTPAIVQDPDLMVSRLHPDDVASSYAPLEESLRTGLPWHWEFRYQHPTEGEKWLETHFVPGQDVEGKIIWNGLVLDATQRKRSEAQLATSEAQLESALDAAEMGAWVWDPERNLIWGNESQRRLWQMPDTKPGWFAVQDARSQLHPDDLERVDGALAHALATGEPLHMEFRIRRPDGSTRWIAVRSRAELDASGRARRLVGINVDVTQQRLHAETTLRSQKLEALGTLAGGIAHDFNNVLFAIEGNSALALESIDPNNPALNYLQQIRGAARRATELVAQILAFSLPQDQKLEVSTLDEPVREAIRLVRATTPAMISIECTIDPQTPTVLADASRMVQVIVNLCTNAVHAIGKGRAGLIELALAPLHVNGQPDFATVRVPQGDYAVLTISDNGCGMNEQTMERIFDPFFTTKAPGEGTGLGLSVAHGIVKALDGLITVYSQPGKGSIFRLYFPATASLRTTPTPGSRKQRLRGKGQRILFVDDESMLVQLGTSLLGALGYRPEAYRDAEEALEAFRREPQSYDAVVTDLSMPSMSGFELSRALLAIRNNLPILLMSGYIGPEERATAAQIGVRELVLKPVTIDQFAELLNRLC